RRPAPASLAGHPGRGLQAGHALTFTPDHLVGAGHRHLRPCRGPWHVDETYREMPHLRQTRPALPTRS
ncbi:MAG TPA: hypothetical protein VK357_17220, partial [Rubrobacteraceae bacterium]|nr:hypothetical protein [Rubrobacteraceae bacterium]